jgi:hypothetical protein
LYLFDKPKYESKQNRPLKNGLPESNTKQTWQIVQKSSNPLAQNPIILYNNKEQENPPKGAFYEIYETPDRALSRNSYDGGSRYRPSLWSDCL